MYSYLFDSTLNEKRYESEIGRIEFRLIELGLNGRMDRLSILKNMRELIEGAIQRGATTVVVVGDDATVAKAVSIVAPYDVTLGIIPVGKRQTIANALGIPSGVAACDVLSRRIVRTIDLGKANEQYFLFSIDVPANDVTVECDGHFRVSLLGLPRPFSICNFMPKSQPGDAATDCNPEDGQLEAIINEPKTGWGMFARPATAGRTVLPFKRATITSGTSSVPLMLDGQTVVKTPTKVEVAPRKLRVIVGRDRRF